jgi:ABC-type polysaccharide/polyol phosphate transport system ATPase subunit
MATRSDNGSSTAAVQAGDLTKRYRLGEHRSLGNTLRQLSGRAVHTETDSIAALAGVDFRVAEGETLGIVGGNGSGKSTLFQLISGITLPTGGWLTIRGRVLPLLAVGTGFHPELTGRENVNLFGASIGIPQRVIRDSMDRVASFAELELHMDTPVKRYSSGMLSRLSFATAVLFPADVYLFDEVLALVDAEFQERCLTEIAQLAEAGRTVLFVSHDLDQVAALADQVMWLEGGRVRDIGPAGEVLARYAQYHSPQAPDS